MFVLLLSIKKALLASVRSQRGNHVTAACPGALSGEKPAPSACAHACATSPPNLLSSNVFPTERRQEQETGTVTFLLISTCALLFSWKCQLLLYKREGHKCPGTWPSVMVGERTRQRSEMLPRQKTQCCGRPRLFAVPTHGIIWLCFL